MPQKVDQQGGGFFLRGYPAYGGRVSWQVLLCVMTLGKQEESCRMLDGDTSQLLQ
ncbi:hypothetical protein [Propionispora hippei]|uniref:Uncharacterized protein n=1 Tax=Propionispora hippei DSM 15287 TaxID=1123003 RepID=A0A1M6NME0_9FIRM|nr:hypothetical protein [Propionispora hippei]SHJ96868.1 hypothetical protein SAMN02745170_03815 [Propionispora hippei DSM 15287]